LKIHQKAKQEEENNQLEEVIIILMPAWMSLPDKNGEFRVIEEASN
jgi:hypothetical protein